MQVKMILLVTEVTVKKMPTIVEITVNRKKLNRSDL